MCETVGNHKPFNEPDKSYAHTIKKVFEVYPFLLEDGVSKEAKRRKDFVRVNDDGSFSFLREMIFIYEDGKIELIRLINKTKYHSTMQVSMGAGLVSPKQLVCLN